MKGLTEKMNYMERAEETYKQQMHDTNERSSKVSVRSTFSSSTLTWLEVHKELQ